MLKYRVQNPHIFSRFIIDFISLLIKEIRPKLLRWCIFSHKTGFLLRETVLFSWFGMASSDIAGRTNLEVRMRKYAHFALSYLTITRQDDQSSLRRKIFKCDQKGRALEKTSKQAGAELGFRCTVINICCFILINMKLPSLILLAELSRPPFQVTPF